MPTTQQGGIPIYGTGANAGKLEGYNSGGTDGQPYFLPNTSPFATKDNSVWNTATDWNSTPTQGGSGQNNLNQPATQPGNPAAASTAIANAPTSKSSGQLSYQDALANLNKGGLSGNALGQAQQSLKNKYQGGLSSAQASGVDSPTSTGAGAAMVQKNLPPTPPTQEETIKGLTPPTTPAVTDFFGTNEGVQQIAQSTLDFLSPPAVKDEMFNQMQKIVGEQNTLSSEQLSLMNMKNIMQGTPDDIRTEVTKANGFATESQVQAMAVSRNSVLLKQASFLQDQMQYQQGLIANDTSLLNFEKDMANTQFNQRMSVMQYQQQNVKDMRNAALDSFKTIVSALGYDGAYAAYQNNPQQLAAIGHISGLGADGLKQAAIQAQQTKLTAQTKENLQLDVLRSNLLTDQYQRSNIASQINERNNPMGVSTLNGKPQNASQASANGYADRLNESNLTIDQLGKKFSGNFSQLPFVPNFLKSGDRQAYEAAKTNFVTAVLRRESGASISPTEFKNEELKYFPQPGDKASTVTFKESARNTAINNLYREANINRPVLPGMIIESNGKKYKVGSDGQSLTAI